MDAHMTPPPAVPRPLSATAAAGDAIELVKRRLFPFQFDRWLTLGFAAFLDQCGRSGSGGSSARAGNKWGGGGSDGSGLPDLSTAPDWIRGHLLLIVAIAAVALVVVVALSALILWINSRGVFVYLDDVATGRAEIARPWREHAGKASSYFVWSFGGALAALVAVLVMLAPIVWAVLGLMKGETRAGALVVLVLCGLVVFAVAVAAGVFSILLRDFAAPLQMLYGIPCGQALSMAWTIASANLGAFLLYVVLKIVFAVAAALAAVLVGCATCCLGFLPVVSQTLLQPLFYFERAWSLFLLRQAGHDVFPADEAPLPAP
jgi:hypothetical protein